MGKRKRIRKHVHKIFYLGFRMKWAAADRRIKTLSNAMSSVVAFILSLGVFSGMQLYRNQLASSGPIQVLGGGLGAILFLFILSAIGNLELVLFGKGFQTGLFPEDLDPQDIILILFITLVAICLILALVASGMVHGVCITTCFIFSLITLYYVNRISQTTYSLQSTTSNLHSSSSKKKK